MSKVLCNVPGSSIAGCTANVSGLAATPHASIPQPLLISVAYTGLTSRDTAVMPYSPFKKVATHIKRLIEMLLARPYLVPEVRSYLQAAAQCPESFTRKAMVVIKCTDWCFAKQPTAQQYAAKTV